MCRRLLLPVLVLSLTAFTAFAGSKDYSRLARISNIEGNVSFMHPKEVEWSAASVNMPLQVADRLYTGADGRAEIEFDDGSVVRLAGKTDVEILSLDENLIQLRILLGLSTLTVRSGVGFEVNTPAAAFNTLRKGVYRFDVAENGDSDAIVRKGLLEAANNNFSRQVDSDEVIHVTAGENSTNTIARYDARDEWDEWNDRRNADIMARASRSYLPDDVYMGASDLDRYGRWVTVADYGPAWVPSYADPMWSPYWSGRWCYRPFWGWTWVSYEPWGWLPYHYGRWYHQTSFGWCWLPGASFGFHFWSPGLVRFYNGPGWVSWAPLGPGDYYNVNNYYFNNIYAYQLNNLRVLQRRSPGDLVNLNAPGAFRTVRTEHFVGNSFGPSSRIAAVSDVSQPWVRGRVITDRLNIQPTSASFAPAPERPVVRPTNVNDRLPVVVRTQPAAKEGGGERFIRATPGPAVSSGRGAPGAAISPGGAGPESARPSERGPGIWNRRSQDVNEPGSNTPGRVLQTPPPSRGDSPRNVERGVPNRPDNPNASSRQVGPSNPGRTIDPRRGTEVPARRPEMSSPPSPPPSRGVEKPRPESRPRPKDPPDSYSYSYSPRTYSYSSRSAVSANDSWNSPPSYSRGQSSVEREQSNGMNGRLERIPAYNYPNRVESRPDYGAQRLGDARRAQEPGRVFQTPRTWSAESPQRGGRYSAPAPERGGSSVPWFGRGAATPSPAPGRIFSAPQAPAAAGRSWGSAGGGGAPNRGGGPGVVGRRRN